MQSRSCISKLGQALPSPSVIFAGYHDASPIKSQSIPSPGFRNLNTIETILPCCPIPSSNRRNETYLNTTRRTIQINKPFSQRSVRHAPAGCRGGNGIRTFTTHYGQVSTQLSVVKETGPPRRILGKNWRGSARKSLPKIEYEPSTSVLRRCPSSFRHRKKRTPASALYHWLDLEKEDEKCQFYKNTWPDLDGDYPHSQVLRTLQTLLELHHHDVFSIPPPTPTYRDITPGANGEPNQDKIDDVELHSWAWILLGDGADGKIERFFALNSRKPPFLLLIILQWDIRKVESLRQVVVYFWTEILKQSAEAVAESENNGIGFPSEASRVVSADQPYALSDASFMRFVTRLHYHARKTWPAALPSINASLGHYFGMVLFRTSVRADELSPKLHRRFCRLYNTFIHRLGLPSVDPYNSMAQYLKAQRILFALEDKFEPSLLLDERSYHTTIAIFAASEKSQRESKAASLQVRGWPPWRKAQDGIDERRTPEQDKSRVLLALAQKNTSGYRDRHVIDEVLRIHGGEELDLTPTIHTRRWVTDRYNRSLKALENPSTNPKVWAARITATRDVQEAWSAFEEYRQNLGDPSLAMFFAMFQKLVYENLRRARNDPGPIIPGDGLEVLPVPENNFSESYKAHLQPPSLLELYDEMLACGILPAGRCLSFLVKHAPSITRGLSYLRDSKLFQPAQLSWLEGVPDRKDIVLPDNRSIVLSIPEHIFAAVVSLKCRFALRVLRDKPEAMNTGLSTATLPSDHPLIPKDQSSEAKFHGTFRSLPHVASLMKAQRSCYRPTWYALFKAIARPGTVMAKPFAGTQKDDRLSWRVLEAALNDFHSLGLELDPQGFNIICYGLCKAIPALKSERGEFYDAARVTETLKLEFKEMCKASEPSHLLPSLSYSVRSPHLHAYVRALGLAGDLPGVIELLEWMILNREEMKHGHDIRSVFVGIVHFLGSLGEAEPLLQKGAGIWGGWPQAKEIEHYRQHGLQS